LDSAGTLFVVGGTTATNLPLAHYLSTPFLETSTAFVSKIGADTVTFAPALTIALGANNQITINWPSPSTGFALMTTTSLAPPANWQAVPNAVSDNGTIRTVVLTNSLDRTNHFYRLQGI
jgi:hypothetical protein